MACTRRLILCCLVASVFSSQTYEYDSSLTPQYLHDFGQRAGNNMVALLGTAFADIEHSITEHVRNSPIAGTKGNLFGNEAFRDHLCRLMECTAWSEWSPCLFEGREEFGFAKKVRECGFNNSLCSYPEDLARNETRSMVCQRNVAECPPHFHIIRKRGNDFCLMHVDEELSYDVAEHKCEVEGAHVVNINNQAKLDAVHELLDEEWGWLTTFIWINGILSNATDSWVYTYGGTPEFEHWASGEEPSGRYTLRTCKGANVVKWELHTVFCDFRYDTVCERV